MHYIGWGKREDSWVHCRRIRPRMLEWHDKAVAAKLRSEGWRTRAALDAADTPATLACTHRLDGDEVQPV